MPTPPSRARNLSYSGQSSSGTSAAAASRSVCTAASCDASSDSASASAARRPRALSVEAVTLLRKLGPLGINRFDQLHDLELVILQLADAPPDRRHIVLQRLQFPGVGDGTRVELLLGLVGPFGERRDLVFEALLATTQFVAPSLRIGELAVDGQDVVFELREVGPDRQRLEAVVQLVGTRVVVLDGE